MGDNQDRRENASSKSKGQQTLPTESKQELDGNEDLLLPQLPFSASTDPLVRRAALNLMEDASEERKRRQNEANERQRIAISLHRSELRLQAALDAGKMATWDWDLEQNKVTCSTSLRELLGVSKEECYDFHFGRFQFVYNEDLHDYRQKVEMGIATATGWRHEFRILRGNDKELTWVEERAHMATDEETGKPIMVGIIWDINDRKRAEISFRKNEERLRSLLNSMDEAYVVKEAILDSAGNVVDWRYIEFNPAFSRILGIKSPLNKTIREIMPEIEPIWIERYATVLSTGEPIRFQDRKGPIDRWLDVFASRIGGPGSLRIALIFTDITERKKAEEALMESEARQAFLLRLNDALRYERDQEKLLRMGCSLFGEFLRVNRVNYADILGEEFILKTYFAKEVQPVHKRAAVKDLGRSLLNAFGTGQPVAVNDVQTDPRVLPEKRAYYQTEDVGSFAAVLLVKQQRWVAAFSAECKMPRRWKPSELELIQDVADRIWGAIQRARAEAALQQSEDRFRTLADSIPQIIWTNTAAGETNYLNKRWYEYTGRTTENSMGGGWQAIVHPDDEATSVGRWHAALVAGIIFDCEYRLRGKDGKYRWFIGRNVPIKNPRGQIVAWFGSATDIQDFKSSQDALRGSKEQLRLIVENAREYAIFSMNLNRTVTSWNSGAHSILGYNPDEAAGMLGDVIFTPEDRAAGAPDQEASVALRDGKANDERWHMRKNGELFWASGVLMAMHGADGSIIGFVKILRDHTEEKMHQEALAATQKQMEAALSDAERARKEAEAANKTKDHFLATLSHELRTPLTPIMMAAEALLRRPDLPQRVKEGLEMIRENVEMETVLVSDLLDLTRISRDKFELKRELVSVHTILRRAIQVTQVDIETRQQQLIVQLDATKDQITGDGDRLQQVFWNILKNASKFTPGNGTIRVSTQSGPNHIFIEIADTGCGIESTALPYIFEAFRQADEVTAREYGGLGLGLAIAKAIVDGHDGQITARSEGVDQGSTFQIKLPLK